MNKVGDLEPLSKRKETLTSQPGGRKFVFCEKLYLKDWFYHPRPNEIYSNLKRILISSEAVSLLQNDLGLVKQTHSAP